MCGVDYNGASPFNLLTLLTEDIDRSNCVQKPTDDLDMVISNFLAFIVPYTRSSAVACMEPNSLLDQDR